MLEIFIVEDPELSSILKDSFAARSEVALEACSSVDELLERVARSTADIALLTGGDGTLGAERLCRRAKDAGVSRVWWLGDVDEVAAATTGGAEQVFVRPLTRDTILEALAAQLPGLRRRGPRRASRLQVDYFYGDREQVGYTRDLGVNGAFIRTRDAIPEGAGLQLIFDLPERYGKTIRADARVVREVAAECDSYMLPGVGVEFLRMGDRDHHELSRYVEDAEGGP